MEWHCEHDSNDSRAGQSLSNFIIRLFKFDIWFFIVQSIFRFARVAFQDEIKTIIKNNHEQKIHNEDTF